MNQSTRCACLGVLLIGAVFSSAYISPISRAVASPDHAQTKQTISAATDDAVQFNRDIRPILTDNCFHCHGPDPASRKAGLRLDRDSSLFGKTENGVAVVPGRPEQSDVYTRMISDDEEEIMPPVKTKKVLTTQQKDLVKKWITQGAKWEAHWSFNAPKKVVPPVANDARWNQNPIDQFVFAKLVASDLKPAPEAPRRALARRAALDLTGLPPEPSDVQLFVDDKSPDAYEKFVDKMMALPQYGEHRARYWLDAARYGDTHGLHFDNYREMWPYRNWVINAYNANMAFNEFSIEQLAGDLMPHSTQDQQIATGFVRCGITTNEGGTIAEENLVLYARDRTETAARVWLGLTMNCCVCHDHKFDPISQKDFYSLSAYFNNNTMSALDGNIKNTPPALVIPRQEDEEHFKSLSAKMEPLQSQLAARRESATPDFDRWIATAKPDNVAENLPSRGMHFHADLSEGGEVRDVAYTLDGDDLKATLHPSAKWKAGNISPKAISVDAAAPLELAQVGDFESDRPYAASAWIKLPGPNITGAIVARMDDSSGYRGWDLWVEGGKIGGHIINHWQDSAIKVIGRTVLDPAKWHHVCLTYDGTRKAAGVKIYVDGKMDRVTIANDNLKDSIRTKTPFKVGQRLGSSLIKGLLLQDARLYMRAITPDEDKILATATVLKNLLAKAPDKRTEPEKKNLFEWWLTNKDTISDQLLSQINDLQQPMDQIKSRGAETLVMAEKPTPAGAFLLYRGEYDQRRDPVTPNVPGILPRLPEKAPANRLALADWLFAPQHPLTSRVTVNRIWQEIFGQGFVRTPDDFGITGDTPSHPELLDYLAVDFRENNWDVKRLIKLIVMSQTYRQSAVTTIEKLEKDPSNRLLAHGPRFRMDAEMVRDAALAESVLLAKTIGGPSVHPYQPDGVWEAVAMPESNTRVYKQDHGDDLYRRSIYTFWKRAAPPASLDAFNAPSREQCTVRRERTNTPLQALVTLNDVQYMEAARHLAQLAIKQAAEDKVESRINFMSQRVLSRAMNEKELAVCKSTLDDLAKFYSEHKDEAARLISYGESKADASIDPTQHAAWTVLANQILNLDEALNK